jgi:hypothetical protein
MEPRTLGKWYLGGIRVDPEVFTGIREIADRRGEIVSTTVEKALRQYVAADKRKRGADG